MSPGNERRPQADPEATKTFGGVSHTVQPTPVINGEALGAYIEHFRWRVLQDALNEATADYWRRRAQTFEQVGTPACDEIAVACRNRAAVSLGGAA